jgi:hypothetical protein
MPVENEFSDDGLGFLLTGLGIVTGQEILDAIAIRFSTEDKVKKYLYGLVDYTRVHEFRVTNNEIDHIARKDIAAARINPDLILAIAATDDLIFGLGRMFEVFVEKSGWTIKICRTLDEAVLWIKNGINEKHDHKITLAWVERPGHSLIPGGA